MLQFVLYVQFILTILNPACPSLHAIAKESTLFETYSLLTLEMCRILFFRIEPDSSLPDTGQKIIITGYRVVTGYRILTRYSWIPTISLLETQHF